jgi:Na+:H+ antiporter, NhaA family
LEEITLMRDTQHILSDSFHRFFNSEKSSSVLLIVCTVVSMVIANSASGSEYLAWWQVRVLGLSLEHWINDALMAIFFLLIGLELERELYSGELSNLRSALLPLFAAMGGVIVPALIHFVLNAGTPTQAGMGIPMATDIAFALGVLALLGKRIPDALKVFVVAFAVMDDLFAIVVIALFYTSQVSLGYLMAACAVWLLLVALNRVFRVMLLTPYLLGGALMWFCMHQSGVHATVAGVLLAFAIPFSSKEEDKKSPSHRLEQVLHKPVAFLVLPVFALANTAIVVGVDGMHQLLSANSLGIAAGLLVGKPLGITLACFAVVALGICRLPPHVTWRHMVGAGVLGGIGFTMSIFIANLAFADQAVVINASKLAILLASLLAGLLGFVWFRLISEHPMDDKKPVKAI